VKQVRAQYPRLPILMVTGNAAPDAIRDEIPDVPLLTKPFDHIQLAARVGKLLKGAPVDA
jgi:CheY-like chemotaxis protein